MRWDAIGQFQKLPVHLIFHATQDGTENNYQDVAKFMQFVFRISTSQNTGVDMV
jgi:hypothetical protein